MRLAASRVLLPGGRWLEPGTLTLDGDRIAAVSPGIAPGAERLPGGTLTPGLIDTHTNGAFGVDFATAGPDAWHHARTELAARGVTAVQPTVITAPLPAMVEALARVAAASGPGPGTRIAGAHAEGPFLSPARRGAHRADWVRDPAPDAVATLLAAARGTLRTVTLAPERPGALHAICTLVAAGVIVSLGHSDATAAEAVAGLDAGATLVTHLFNAMRPFAHRDPGLPGAALTDPRALCGLVVDGLHVDPVACRLAFAAAPGRIVAVTDSILIAGMPPGTALPFGGMPVMAGTDGLGRRPDGTISGAGIVLDEGVRRMISAGISPAAVLQAATETAAAALRTPELGRLVPGAVADLVWWDEDWRPARVWLGGREITA